MPSVTPSVTNFWLQTFKYAANLQSWNGAGMQTIQLQLELQRQVQSNQVLIEFGSLHGML